MQGQTEQSEQLLHLQDKGNSLGFSYPAVNVVHHRVIG